MTLLIFLGLATGCVTVKVNLFEEREPLKEKVVSGYGSDKILVMDISGMIIESPERKFRLWPGAAAGPGRVKEELDKAAQDSRIKAVVIKINSPGGTVSASDMVYHEIKKFKAEKPVPVIACCMGLATSGGYYVAQAADLIMAHPTCLTGSIGVLALKLNLKGLMDKVGVEGEFVKTGQWKDFWSPFRPASPAEKQMMQDILGGFHRQFVEVVAQNRRLGGKEAANLADGRIFTADQAKDLGLVDRLGYLDDALDLAKEQAGLTAARVVVYHRPDSYRPNVYSLTPDLAASLTLEMAPQFLYLWWPGEGL
jgi:protease-4